MSPVTRDFQSDSALHPRATELLNEYFAQGWPDPNKIHHQSAHLRNLLAAAREQIGEHLKIRPDSLEFLGELGFGFWIGISGLLNGSGQRFCYSAIDRQVVHSIANTHRHSGGESLLLKPDSNGVVDYSPISHATQADLLCWQATNRETGARQEFPTSSNQVRIFADMTANFELDSLPHRWDVALWDPKNFGGPQGISILAISPDSTWRNTAPSGSRRVFGSFSKPLLLATAVALDETMKKRDRDRKHLGELNRECRYQISQLLPDAQVPGDSSTHDPRYIALVIPGVIAEEVLRTLEQHSFLIDAGSACAAGPLSPSHVLEAMGYGVDGHLRITLKPEHVREDVIALVTQLSLAVKELKA